MLHDSVRAKEAVTTIPGATRRSPLGALVAVLLIGESWAATAVDLRQTVAPPDLILLNGSIYTVEAAQPHVSAA